MNVKKIRAIGIGALVGIWAVLCIWNWVGSAQELSVSERRPLAQLPAITQQSLLSGQWMKDFETYSLDQFPLRDSFRTLKSLSHYYVLNQSDNNDIYLADGYAAKLEYPLSRPSVEHALERFENLYQTYLQGMDVTAAIVPDKGCYLAQENGYPALDYGLLCQRMEQGMPWATFVDLWDTLDVQDYYRTDTHWRQEQILEAAQRLCQALGATQPVREDYTVTQLERPFYGVYYGQAALPMKPETMYILESPLLDACTVYDHETGKTGKIYDMAKLESRDLYDVYLSGPKALLTIENPNAKSDRELIVFRDSFGSAMIPLLVQEYATVTVVDIRYISSQQLEEYITFADQQVLFLYSTLLLNSSASLK